MLDVAELRESLQPLDVKGPPRNSERQRQYFKHYGIDFETEFNDVEHYLGVVDCAEFCIAVHYYQMFEASKTCFLIHGYYDHSGLFSHVIRYCLEQKYSVVVFDLPGHGLSSGAQASIDDFHSYQEVLDKIITVFSDVAPKPWNVIAQSMGGAILAEYLLRQSPEVFSKSVMLAPLLYPVRWGLSMFSFNLLKYFITSIPRGFAENSNDKVFLGFLKNHDPLQAKILPLQWVKALHRWIAQILVLPKCEDSPLIIQGQDDGTVDWKKNIPLFHEKFPNAQVCFLPEGKHHLANESSEIRTQIFAAIDRHFSA